MKHKHCVFCGEEVPVPRPTNFSLICMSHLNTLEPDTCGNRYHATIVGSARNEVAAGRSAPAPTAEEPLPPLKIVCRNGAGDSSYMCLQAGKELLAEIFPTRSKRLQQLLDAKDARIAELEEDVRLAKHERNQYDSAHKREVVNVLKLSAKLRAVSDALQEILKTATQFAYNPQLDNAVARIRAIVEGK